MCRKGRLTHHGALLACNVPVSSRTQPGCLQRGWEGFQLPWGCSVGVKAQECRTEVGGGGQSHPLTPPQGVPLGLLVLPSRLSLAWLDQMPAEARVGGGYLQSWGFGEPAARAPGGGEGPRAESLARALTPAARAVPRFS